jgi:hypothetical protein
MAAFAEAVAAGDFERAEGWLAVARFSQERSGASPDPLDRGGLALRSARHRQKA